MAISRMTALGLAGGAALTAFVSAIDRADAAACNSPYAVGDVFASVGNSTVDVFTPTGSLVCTLNDANGGTTTTTGSGFDAAGNFYVTNFDFNSVNSTVSKFDNSGNLISSGFMSSNNSPESIDNQSNGFYAGKSLVGGPGNFSTSQTALINLYSTASGGSPLKSYAVAGGNATGGTDWVDVYDVGSGRVIYDGEGQVIKSAILNPNGTTTQLADFSSGAGLTYIYAMRTIPSGALAGDVLVADTIDAVLLDPLGNVIKTYTLPGLGTLQQGAQDFSMNLDPNGLDFWTGDSASGQIWEVNIATGAIDEHWNTNTGDFTLFGVSVFGEIQNGQGTAAFTAVPEPGSLALLGTALAGFGLFRRRRNRSAASARR